MLKYTEDHEWLRPEGDEIVVGITAHASEQLGDVVFIELPEVGREVAEQYPHLANGIEVTEDVFESDANIAFEEAENRMHSIKAVLVSSLS